MDINTSLLREKFVIQEKNMASAARALRTSAFSNRMTLKLQSGSLPEETFIIRTKTMHACSRMCAQVADNYDRHGPIIPRLAGVKWESIWDETLGDYDRRYYKDTWCAVYYKGKPVFIKGKPHKFFDVIEHCDYVGKGSYHTAIPIAKKAFGQAGKEIDIDYDSNVAMVAIGNRLGGRCSMLTRGADHATTFNMNIKPKSGEKLHITQLLSSAADFLEATQLCYVIGDTHEYIDAGLIEKFSDEDRKAKRAAEELRALDAKIDSLEHRHRVRYRPERPSFDHLIEEAQREAREKLQMIHDDEYVD